MRKHLLAFVLLILSGGVISAQTNPIISEIYYNDPGSPDTLEFIELHNPGANALSLTGYTITDGIVDTLPSVFIPANGYYVVCKDSIAMFGTFAISAHQWISGSLDNAGETIVITAPSGTTADSVTYGDSSPWDTLADGDGPSLVICPDDLSEDNSKPSTWKIEIKGSDNRNLFNRFGLQVIASPGRENCADFTSVRDVVNEFILYPNPVRDQLIIEGNVKEGRVQFVNADGRLMKDVPLTNIIDVTVLNQGIFYIKILTEGSVVTHRIAKL